MKSGEEFKTIDQYIASQANEVREILEEIRLTIQKAAPKSVEVISYGMPAFRQNGVLVYFAAFKNHIGFFPTASGIANFTSELKNYKSSKGGVQFPLDKKIPLNVISKITKFRVKEDQERAKLKAAKKKK